MPGDAGIWVMIELNKRSAKRFRYSKARHDSIESRILKQNLISHDRKSRFGLTFGFHGRSSRSFCPCGIICQPAASVASEMGLKSDAWHPSADLSRMAQQ